MIYEGKVPQTGAAPQIYGPIYEYALHPIILPYRNRWSIPSSVYHSVCSAAPSGNTLSEKSIRFRYYVQSNKSPNSAQTERNFEEITKSTFSFSVLRILLEEQVDTLSKVLFLG
jgi:hypothetical protein